MTRQTDSVLDPRYISLGRTSVDRDDAIRAAGGLLEQRELVTASYTEAMLQREEVVSTYMGNGVALPHGTFDAKDEVLGTGIVVLQYPDGVEWPNGTAHLVVGLAARNEEHITVLSQLAEVLQEEALCKELWTTDDADFVYRVLSASPAE